MVLQVPNTPTTTTSGATLDTIFAAVAGAAADAIAHVFGEHTTQTFGGYSVPYISPERVQELDFGCAS